MRPTKTLMQKERVQVHIKHSASHFYEKAARILPAWTTAKHRYVSLGAACALLGLLLVAQQVGSRSALYTVQDLGTLGGQTSSANAINNNGDVVGQADTASGSSLAFVWSHGRMRALVGLPSPFTAEADASSESTATAINNEGDIAGDADTGYGTTDGSPRGIYHAVFWHLGAVTDIGSWGSYRDSTALKINDTGIVLGLGIAQEDGPRTHLYTDRVFLYSKGSLRPLPPEFHGQDVNDHAQVIGWQRRSAGGQVLVADGQRSHALGSLPPGQFLVSLVMNDMGQAAGTISDYDDTHDPNRYVFLTYHAIAWQAGKWVRLAELPGYPETKVVGMNTSGQIVGFAAKKYTNGQPLQDTRPVLWQGGRISNLNTSIAPWTGWTLKSATAINDQGQIVGWGEKFGQKHAFLLTPEAQHLAIKK